MSKNGLNKKGKSAHSEELRFTLDSAGRGTAAELLRRLKPYRFKFALSLGLSLVYVFLTLLIPVLAGKIIDCIIGAVGGLRHFRRFLFRRVGHLLSQ